MFLSLKIIKPIWFFHLRSNGKILWPNPQLTEPNIRIDDQYLSIKSATLEASFLMIMRGWIPPKDDDYISIGSKYFNHRPKICDEFRFIRKNFNPLWSIIFTIYCILTLKNPVKIIKSYIKSNRISRIPLFSDLNVKHKFSDRDGLNLLDLEPPVRIIIPTLNRYDNLNNLLKDLENQKYNNFFITIVDQSNPFDENFYKNFKLDIKVIRQNNPGLWKARNNAIMKTQENIIALLDDDSRIESDWIINHLKCLDYFKVMISSGVSISSVGAKVPENYSFFRLSDQIDTGNVFFYKEVFEICGLFDEQFEGMRMGDGEFGLRSYKKGFISISNPVSKRVHLKVKKGGLRQLGSWDAFRPTNILGPRPIPSLIYLVLIYFDQEVLLRYFFKTVPFVLCPYSWKGTYRGYFLSLFLFISFFPFVLLQVSKSYKIAKKMLESGQKIRIIETTE